MSIVVQMAGLAANVKNGIAAVVEIATTLVRNVDLNRKKKNQTRKKKIDFFVYNSIEKMGGKHKKCKFPIYLNITLLI
jgi:hypothetical protein